MSYQTFSPGHQYRQRQPKTICFQNLSIWQLIRHSAIGFNIVAVRLAFAVWSTELPQDQQPVLCTLLHLHPLAYLLFIALRSIPGTLSFVHICLLFVASHQRAAGSCRVMPSLCLQSRGVLAGDGSFLVVMLPALKLAACSPAH